MHLSVQTIVSLAFSGDQFSIANEALSAGLGEKFHTPDTTLDDVRSAYPKIEENLNEQEARARLPNLLTGQSPSANEQMRAITAICKTADRIRSVFAVIDRAETTLAI